MQLGMEVHHWWPICASWQEDIDLWANCWEKIFPARKKFRPVMHDVSNSRPMKPSDPALQSALWNDCHHGCVAKGGMFVQPCGWEGTFELWAGGVDDSGYLTGDGMLDKQKEFAEADATCNLPVMNILDRGHRVTVDAFIRGKQLCLQPCSAPSD